MTLAGRGVVGRGGASLAELVQSPDDEYDDASMLGRCGVEGTE